MASAEEPFQLLDAACAAGVADAWLLKSALLVRGVGYAENLTEAYICVQQAATLGSAFARAQLQVLGPNFDERAWVAPMKLEHIADTPRIFMVQQLIPPHICAWLGNRAAPRLAPALIILADGKVVQDPTRNNTAASIAHTEGDLVTQLVCRRIAAVTNTPLAHHESPNVLRYLPGQKYLPHFDFVLPSQPVAEGPRSDLEALGQRVATVLVYLNHGYEGGQTSFPRLGLNIAGGNGAALIFWNVSEEGEPERNSLHAGVEVTRGEKWILSQWIREKPHPLL